MYRSPFSCGARKWLTIRLTPLSIVEIHRRRSRSKPKNEVSDVSLDVLQLVRLAFYSKARWLRYESWTTTIDVPVVVDEVMKARFSYSPTKVVRMFIPAPLKSHRHVERTTRDPTHAGRNNSSMRFRWGHADTTFMWMRGEEFNQTGSRAGIAH